MRVNFYFILCPLLVLIQCSKHYLDPTFFKMSGYVSGLSGSLVLSDGTESKTLTSNGAFEFSNEVADGATYTVTVVTEPSVQHCTLSNGSGTVSGAPVTNISIDCATKGWTNPTSLNGYFNPGGTNPFTITLRGFVDTSYKAWIAFSQPPAGGGLHQIFYSSYDGNTWTHPANANAYINAVNKRSGNAQIVGNNNGQLVLSWIGWDGTALCGAGVPCYQTFTSSYSNGVWTGLPNRDADNNISPNGSDIVGLDSAMDSSGNAIVVWAQEDGSADAQVFKSEFRNGAWTNPASLADNISPDGSDAFSPHVAMDNNGNAIIVWYQGGNIFKSEYRNGSWTHPANAAAYINPAGGAGGSLPQVAMDNNGNAIIVWKQEDGSDQQVYKSEYRAGTWTHPSALSDNVSPDGKYCFEPHVSMADNGEAVIAWKQYDAGDVLHIFKSEYRSGVWAHPSGLADHISPAGGAAGDTATSYEQLSTAMDKLGNTLIVWRQSDGSTQQVFKSEYTNSTWTHPSALSDNISPDGKDCFTMHASMSNPGMSLILWTQRDGNNDVQAFKSEKK